MVIHGYSNRNWEVHSFEINDFDQDDQDDEDPEEEDPEDLEDEDFQDDPNASYKGEVEANIPIWDPRQYFLRIFNVRSNHTLLSSRHLVQWLERSIENYVC